MGGWLALAEGFDDSLRQPGFGCAAVFASASRTGVDARIVQPLVPAALALTGGDARRALSSPEPPCDCETFASWSEELEAHLSVLVSQCEAHGRAASDEYEAAARARLRAEEAIREAQGAMSDPERRDAAGELMRQAQADAAEASQVMSDCAAALEVLGRADGKARFARDLVRALPGNLAEVYEEAFRLREQGRRLPYHGGFFAPGAPRAA